MENSYSLILKVKLKSWCTWVAIAEFWRRAWNWIHKKVSKPCLYCAVSTNQWSPGVCCCNPPSSSFDLLSLHSRLLHLFISCHLLTTWAPMHLLLAHSFATTLVAACNCSAILVLLICINGSENPNLGHCYL